MATVMLVCAVLASLAFGVLVAYGVCLSMFRLFHVHTMAAARQREVRAAGPRVAVN